jgi:glucose-1-phosphate adenylyltransferase
MFPGGRDQARPSSINPRQAPCPSPHFDFDLRIASWLVAAGGQGARLRPLTDRRSKPAVPFGSRYRMDVTQMIDFHLERDADVTVAALPVPIERASSFGILEINADSRVCGFEEKPEHPRPRPGNPRRAYASMGTYMFSAACLVRALREAHRRGETDFGNHVMPRLLHSRRMFAYDFTRNRIPGLNANEEPAYWRDVGTIDAYFEAHQDTLGGEPCFDLFNPEWPILSSSYQP